ncbi:MAG: hypothetical protein KAH32_04135 [Chlamydiia bacterium]|nr:hypothetical protein [Chlamydiia bacterium]
MEENTADDDRDTNANTRLTQQKMYSILCKEEQERLNYLLSFQKSTTIIIPREPITN